MELKDLKNTVIHCETYEEAKECHELADKLGWRCSSGSRYIDDIKYWYKLKENTCYYFYKGVIASLYFCKNLDCKIKSAQWFLDNFKINKDMEERNIKVSLDTAKEWYNGSDETLKKLALQVYKEEELNKEEVKVWEDLVDIDKPFINAGSVIIPFNYKDDKRYDKYLVNLKVAKSALAMSKISQLFTYFGGKITDEEWENADTAKYTIGRKRCDIYVDSYYGEYYFLAFHKREQRDDFMRYNERLVKDYLMLD